MAVDQPASVPSEHDFLGSGVYSALALRACLCPCDSLLRKNASGFKATGLCPQFSATLKTSAIDRHMRVDFQPYNTLEYSGK